jgi:hypothetical protein
MTIVASALSPTLLQQRIELIILVVVICGLIFELVRRKRLMERYAILWLMAGGTLLVLTLWKGLLTTLSHAAGISYLPSALFAVAFLFVLVMLVHFSMTVSRLSDQNTVLAQRLALLQQRLDQEDVGRDRSHASAAGAPSEDRPRGEKVTARRAAEPPLGG